MKARIETKSRKISLVTSTLSDRQASEITSQKLRLTLSDNLMYNSDIGGRMSDGPHRSLPMRRHWKKFAERASKHSYSLDEVSAVLPSALMNDFKDAPLNQVSGIFLGDGQIPLFQQDCADRLEELRRICRGSTVGNTLIDCAIEANANGLTGEAAINAAVRNASEAYARTILHQIEEHYRRKQPGSQFNVRNRMSAACNQVSFASFASEMMYGNDGTKGKFDVMKRTGIDEGPRL